MTTISKFATILLLQYAGLGPGTHWFLVLV